MRLWSCYTAEDVLEMSTSLSRLIATLSFLPFDRKSFDWFIAYFQSFASSKKATSAKASQRLCYQFTGAHGIINFIDLPVGGKLKRQWMKKIFEKRP